jgi:uncharacterized membrane protein
MKQKTWFSKLFYGDNTPNHPFEFLTYPKVRKAIILAIIGCAFALGFLAWYAWDLLYAIVAVLVFVLSIMISDSEDYNE